MAGKSGGGGGARRASAAASGDDAHVGGAELREELVEAGGELGVDLFGEVDAELDGEVAELGRRAWLVVISGEASILGRPEAGCWGHGKLPRSSGRALGCVGAA